jgi:hypothetical protein
MLPYIRKQYRNINLFPFPDIPVRMSVRTDYPLADGHCQGTLALTMTEVFTLLRSY